MFAVMRALERLDAAQWARGRRIDGSEENPKSVATRVLAEARASRVAARGRIAGAKGGV